MRRFWIVLLIIFICFSISAQEISDKSGDKSVAKPIKQEKHLRERNEWFAAAISASTMGIGVRISAPTIRAKGFFWETLTTEAVFPTWMGWYELAGGAFYTKMGYVHTIKRSSDVRFSLSVGGHYFFGTDHTGVVTTGFVGFYLDPEISYVYSFNEKYAIQFGLSCPLLFPKLFPYPGRVFIGFRY